mmetsp:Transcript_7257/g.18040  ORF Transcript_7257/g.18040 Transcript_7257/m.18040 type:complete len:477 (-) Transcript_7257:1240-2670(-)
MAKPSAVIIGGGVTGLSIAHRLITKGAGRINVTLLEGSNRVGGWVSSQRSNGILYEEGPRSLRVAGSGHVTLKLIGELGIEDRIVPADNMSNVRYLWLNGRRQALPSGLLSAITNPLAPNFAMAIMREPFASLSADKDESMHSFFKRRMGSFIADKVITAVVSGVWAGDARQLSIKSCMPPLAEMEARSGSLVLDGVYGIFDKKRPPRPTPPPEHVTKHLKGASVFSFQDGIQTLTDELYSRVKDSVKLSTRVSSVAAKAGGGVNVTLEGGGQIHADHVFSAVDAQTLSRLVRDVDKESADALGSIQPTSLAVIGLAYKAEGSGKLGGFGHLVCQGEQSDALGVVYDSDNFPTQSAGVRRLTVMAGGATRGGREFLNSYTDAELEDMALRVVREQTGITDQAVEVRVGRAVDAISQYNVGHSGARDLARERLSTRARWLSFVGASFDGVGVNDCILHGQNAADRFIGNEYLAGRLR